jgi:choline dehydrogenase
MRDSTSEYDYVIVGAGSAGCVLANRLSLDPTIRVLLLEAGQPDRLRNIHIPAAWSRTLQTPFDWQYMTEPQAQLDGRTLYWPRGKTLGGSSSINAMIYVRGSDWDYDHWAALGCNGWSYADVLPYFKRSEHQTRGEDEYHGTRGALHISDPTSPNPMTVAFLRAAQAAGIPFQDDFNGASQEGVGLYQTTTKNGKRHSAAKAFLVPALGRPNLKVLTGALVTKVLFENQTAVGVQYLQSRGRQIKSVRAAREIILCGGAVNSPQVLMLSGIGAADQLRRLNIDVVADVPGVGQNLQDHLITGVGFYSPRPVSLANAERPRDIAQYVLFGRGMLRSNGAEAGGFTQLTNDVPAPDLQFHFLPIFIYDHGLTRLDGHGFALGVTALRPQSRGCIMLRSADPLTHPLIQPNYLQAGADLRLLIDGIRRAREVIYQDAMRPYRGVEFNPGYAQQSDEALAAYIRWQVQTIYHPVGTCKMGVDEASVVDPQLRVRGVERLRVVDASIMPTITSGNTNAPTIMIGEKAADLILGINSSSEAVRQAD